LQYINAGEQTFGMNYVSNRKAHAKQTVGLIKLAGIRTLDRTARIILPQKQTRDQKQLANGL